MSGYKLVMGFMVFIITILLWIPLEYASTLTATILNSAVTDATAIQMNNIMARVFYYSLFIIFIALLIYILKPDSGEQEEGETAWNFG
jgi:hypothetical protein